jgi:hypothetical protein
VRKLLKVAAVYFVYSGGEPLVRAVLGPAYGLFRDLVALLSVNGKLPF